MKSIQCPGCQGSIPYDTARPVRFCPFCGKPLGQEDTAVSEMDARLAQAKKPVDKYRIIQEAIAANPDDFAANRALLYHGRLHEALNRRGMDYSAIKCHLLSVLDTPVQYTQAELDAKYGELLRGAQLEKTMALAPDADAFFTAYLHEMAYAYIDLFIRGDRRVSAAAFGISRTQQSMARRAAVSVRRMLAEARETPRLEEAERVLLIHAIRAGFVRVFPGQEACLSEE